MSKLTPQIVHTAQATEDTPVLRLEQALKTFATAPDDVWISASAAFDAVAASLEHAMHRHSFARSELMTVIDCMNAALQDFEEPDQLTRDVTAMLYYFVEIAAADLDLQPPPRFREALYYATLRTISLDLDLLPLRMWQLAQALYDAARHDDLGRARDTLSDIRAVVLTQHPAHEVRRYHYEPDQHFLNTSDEEDEDEDEADGTPHPDLGEVRNYSDPGIPLSEVLWSTDDARCRLDRLLERQRGLCHHVSTDHPDATLLAERIDFTREHIAWVEGMNANRRAERVKQLH